MPNSHFAEAQARRPHVPAPSPTPLPCRAHRYGCLYPSPALWLSPAVRIDPGADLTLSAYWSGGALPSHSFIISMLSIILIHASITSCALWTVHGPAFSGGCLPWHPSVLCPTTLSRSCSLVCLSDLVYMSSTLWDVAALSPAPKSVLSVECSRLVHGLCHLLSLTHQHSPSLTMHHT